MSNYTGGGIPDELIKANKKKKRKSWFEADRKGNVIQRALHDQKVKGSDKKFLKMQKLKIEQANKRNRRSASSFTAEESLAARQRHRVWKEKREDMRALRKSDPEAYKKLKREERRKKARNRKRSGSI